jgi:hypothetical protein
MKNEPEFEVVSLDTLTLENYQTAYKVVLIANIPPDFKLGKYKIKFEKIKEEIKPSVY